MSVLIAERFFSGVLHAHLLGVCNQDVLFSSQRRPSGTGGTSIGRGGGQGMRPRSHFNSQRSSADGVKDAGETGARTDPPDARAGSAVSVTGSPPYATQRHIVRTQFPAEGTRWGEAAKGISCERGTSGADAQYVLCDRRGKQGQVPRRAGTSIVALAGHSCHPPNGARLISAQARTHLIASTRYAERGRSRRGGRASCPPACLRRLQAAERNVVKRQASGVVRWQPRSEVECSRLKRTE